jgi:hypothetical protein
MEAFRVLSGSLVTHSLASIRLDDEKVVAYTSMPCKRGFLESARLKGPDNIPPSGCRSVFTALYLIMCRTGV